MIDSGVWHMHFAEKMVGLGLIEQPVDAMTDPVQVCLDICHAFFIITATWFAIIGRSSAGKWLLLMFCLC